MKEEHLRLFTPVSEGLPDSGASNAVIVLIGSKHRMYGHISPISGVWLNDDYEEIYGVTHWLDLSKLTTKERAIELVRQAFSDGFFCDEDSYNEDIEDFITQNKGRL